MALAGDEIRVISFNCACGNPRILTPQASFVELPFYSEALASEPGAAILALQEVGTEQAFALRRAARAGTAAILEARRPGQGNALVVPARYEVTRRRRGWYVRPHAEGLAAGVAAWAHRRAKRDWRQFGELRMWIGARLRDRRSGRSFTVLTTHLSLDPGLKLAQARAIVRRAHAASAAGPVVLAGDLNVAARGRARGRDVAVAELLATLRDMGTAALPPGRANIDYVLALGFEPVSSRLWTGDALRLPGSPDAEHVSDHYAEDDVLRFSPG